MTQIKVKAFVEALFELHYEPQRIKKILEDKRMTIPEKDIIRCLLLIRDNKNLEVIEKLIKIPPQLDFVQTAKEYILGVAYNNLGRLLEAIPHLTNAHTQSHKFNHQTFKLLTLFNLYNTHFNLRNFRQCHLLAKEAHEYTPANNREKYYVLRIQFNDALNAGKESEAQKLILQMDKLLPGMNDYDQVALLYEKIDFYLHVEKLDLVNEALEELKKHKKYFQTANFKFMRALMSFILEDKPIYLYQSDFKDSPVMWWHIRVLQCLEERDAVTATEFWQKLQENCPEAFDGPFQYKGGKNFFHYCLKKLNPAVSAPVSKRVGGLVKDAGIIEFLRESNGPVRKEDLYQAIYGKEADDKEDYNKLRSVIKRLRQKYEVEITYTRNCYLLKGVDILKKSG